MEALSKALYYEGFNLIIKPTLKVRHIYFNMNTTLTNIDMNEISTNLTKVWSIYLSYNHLLKDSTVNATALERFLYYDDK